MGAGKSRALANIARQLLPGGFLLLDGKGDDTAGNLVATVRQLLPPEAERRLLIIDPLDAAWPVGLNPLHGIDLRRAGGMSQALGMVLAIFERLDPETWAKSMGMQQFAQMGALLVLEAEPQPSLLALKRVLEDEVYRAGLLESARNPEVRTFWLETFPRSGEQQRGSRDALLRRLDNLLVDETLRYLLIQPEPTVDLLEAMEDGLIVLIPLPHVTLGGLAGFVAMLLFQAIVRAAFRRPGSDQSRRTVPLIIDEFQVFAGSGDSADVRAAITQLRSLGIGAIYAHQSLLQLGALRDEMLQNSAARLILRTGEPDASAYAHLFPTADLTAADISGQPADEHQYLVLAGADPCSIRPLSWPAPLENGADLPAYHGPDWQSRTPAIAANLAAYDQTLLQIIYREDDLQRLAGDLARLPAADWQFLLERWKRLRQYQRDYILRQPGCIPDRLERQRWLSRLAYATPRVLAMASYERNRIAAHHPASML
jgi:hypothetical protein